MGTPSAELLAVMDALLRGEAPLSAEEVAACDPEEARCMQLLLAMQDRLEGLEQDRLFLESIVENLPDMIFVKEAQELRFVRFNKAGEELLGYPRDALLGKNDRDFFPPEEAEFFIAKDREVLAAGGVLDIPEEPIHTAQKGQRFLHTKKIPILDESGQPLYLLGISEDITERRERERELQEAQAALAQEQVERRLLENQRLESLGLLAGGIAHDFNNLLMGMLGNASLGLLHLEEDHSAREPVRRIERAAQRASDLTRQILAFSGKGRFLVTPMSLTHLVEEIVGLLEVSIAGRAALKLDLDDEVPAVEADATQMRQLVMNLITNAADALESTNGVITVVTGVVDADADYLRRATPAADLAPGRYVCLEVSDTGHGMDAETQARMFDPFFTTRESGHGLGLAAIQGIVRAHGGAILVYSEPGDGTTIKVLLPGSTAEAVSLADAPITDGSVPGEGTVLVVDDEALIRIFAKESLELGGYEVLLANGGAEAVAIFEEDPRRIDLVLLDMTMPRMNGEETFRALRRIRPVLKVLLPLRRQGPRGVHPEALPRPGTDRAGPGAALGLRTTPRAGCPARPARPAPGRPPPRPVRRCDRTGGRPGPRRGPWRS